MTKIYLKLYYNFRTLQQLPYPVVLFVVSPAGLVSDIARSSVLLAIRNVLSIATQSAVRVVSASLAVHCGCIPRRTTPPYPVHDRRVCRAQRKKTMLRAV